MSCSLIIDARHHLRWHERLLSDASTAILWSGWLWLCLPLLRAYASFAELGPRLSPALPNLFALGSEDVLGQSVVALIGASGTLMAWNRLPARRARAAPALSSREQAQYFELPEHELRASREAAVVVVHHDEQGRIVRLEQRALGARAEDRAA